MDNHEIVEDNGEDQEELAPCAECGEKLPEDNLTECEILDGSGSTITQVLCEACESDLCYSDSAGTYLHPDIAVWVESREEYMCPHYRNSTSLTRMLRIALE